MLFPEAFIITAILFFYRIVDNMPVTWCYEVEDNQKFCNPGFPIGCYVTKEGHPRGACVISVSSLKVHLETSQYVYLLTSEFANI